MGTPDFTGAIVPLPGQGDRIIANYQAWDLQAGDVLLMMGRGQGTTPAEITGIAPGFARGGVAGSIPAGDRFTGIFYHRVTDPEAEPESYTFIGVSGGGNSRIMAAMAVVRGADVDHINDGGLMYRPDAFIPAVEAGELPYLMIAIWGAEFTAGNSVVPNSVPAGLDVELIAQTLGGADAVLAPNSSTTGSRTGLVVTSQQVGLEGPKNHPSMTMGWPGAPTSIKAASMMIRGTLVEPTQGYPVKRGDGTEAMVSYLDGTGARQTPSRVSIWLPGAPDVEAVLQKPGLTMAHRGGSSNWPEYSEVAYDRSVEYGYPVLEFSCAYSNDPTPVLFGMGEQYLDRIAGVTGNIDPTTLSWAQISSTYRNVLRPLSPGTTQPLYRLEEFLEKYSKTHVLLVDPKFGFANAAKVNAMLDICDAFGGPEKIVIKFDSPTNNFVLPDAAHARANPYQTMNYWGTEVEKLTPAYGTDKWDWIGVRYDAPQSTYDVATGIGKPVWAAVIPDQAGYNTALARGADLMMCSNVAGIAVVN